MCILLKTLVFYLSVCVCMRATYVWVQGSLEAES